MTWASAAIRWTAPIIDTDREAAIMGTKDTTTAAGEHR
jgi:hypothetical protein